MDRATERLRFTPRSLVVAVALLGVALAMLRLLASTTRVIGWVLAAMTLAGLFHPIVAVAARVVPRAVAIALVAVVTLAAASTVAYGLVDDIVRETHALQAAAPDVGRNLERSRRFGETARKLQLEERITRFAKAAPQRLQGGDTAKALRAAATRGVAFLITGVLTLFMLLHGPRLVAAGLHQFRDPDRRQRLTDRAAVTYRRGWIYVAGSVGMAMVAGLLAFVVARAFDVPGAAPLALWVALWDLVPMVGAAIGAVPIVLLASTLGSPGRGAAVAAILFGYAALEALLVQPWIEARSLRLGPFLTIVAGLVGVELYGIGGALLSVIAAVLAMAAFTATTPPNSLQSAPESEA